MDRLVPKVESRKIESRTHDGKNTFEIVPEGIGLDLPVDTKSYFARKGLLLEVQVFEIFDSFVLWN